MRRRAETMGNRAEFSIPLSCVCSRARTFEFNTRYSLHNNNNI